MIEALGAQMRSEWTKLRTVRSSLSTIAVTLVVGAGVSVLAMGEIQAHWTTISLPERAGFHPVQVSLTGAFFCQFVLGVLGALAVSDGALVRRDA